MIKGEITKYHEAARGIVGQRIAAGSFNAITYGKDESLELVAAANPNVFGNISDGRNQNEANLLANSQGSSGGDLSFGGTSTAQRLGTGAQKAEKAEKDRKSFQDQAFRTLLDRIHYLDKQIAWHDGEITRLTQRRDLLAQQIEKLRRGESPELQADGTLRDSVLEGAVREYEERTGETVDRNNPGKLQSAFEDVHADDGRRIKDHVRDKGGLEREREGHIDEMRQSHPEEAAELFGETYENDGRVAAEVSLAHAESDEVQTAVVDAQGFDSETEGNTLAAAQAEEPSDFFASSDDATVQLGTRTQGELKGEFASAVSEISAPPTRQGAPSIVSEKPSEPNQQLNG